MNTPARKQRSIHRRRLLVATATFVLGTLCATAAAVPASAWSWRKPTTTTTKPTTTTTRPTTTTTRPTTTTTQPTTTTTQPTTTTTQPTTTTTAGPTVPPVTGGGNCGGETPLKADGTPYTCSLSEEFDGTSINRDLWVPQTSRASAFGSQDDCYMDDPDNIAVANGQLRLSVIKEAAPFTCTTPKGSYTTQYTSASLSTFMKWSQAFGRFEFKAKFPSATTKGLHGALWLWPDNQFKYGAWPASGEIDVAEVYSQYNDRAIPFVHYVTTNTTVTNNWCLISVDQWHTYAVDWSPTHITITFDGKVCVNEKITPWGLTAPAPFDHPFMVALTQGLGVSGNRMDPAAPPAVPATLEVDYVRVWK